MAQQMMPHDGGQQEGRVSPGPIRGGHCPPPREIVLVDARKVFDFCTQQDTLERCFCVADLGPDAAVIDCQIVNISCQEIAEREPIIGGEGRALVSIQVNLTVRITLMPGNNQPPITVERNIAFPKRVILCAPMGTDVTCDVRGTCICTVQPPGSTGCPVEANVCCTLQLVITITVTAPVKVLVPSFGMVMPRECQAPVPAAMLPEECPDSIGDIRDRKCR